MTIARYPPHKQIEVQNKFFEIVNKYPYDKPIMKRIVRLAVRVTQDGYEVISLYDIPEGKFTEAFNRTASTIHEYSTIEGYTAEIFAFAIMTFLFIYNSSLFGIFWYISNFI